MGILQDLEALGEEDRHLLDCVLDITARKLIEMKPEAASYTVAEVRASLVQLIDKGLIVLVDGPLGPMWTATPLGQAIGRTITGSW